MEQNKTDKQEELKKENIENPEEVKEEVLEEILEDLEKQEAGKEKASEADGKKEETGEKEGKVFKKKKTDKKQDALQEKINELQDKCMRQMAEFDNFRKRTEKEKSAMFETGAKSVIEKILPVVDNFERGLAAVPEEQKEDSFVTGMEMIYKQIMTTLESVGVKPIEAVGTEFNPDLHNAVMHVEDEEAGDNMVVEEFQKGYTYRDSVVRHSMVKVAN